MRLNISLSTLWVGYRYVFACLLMLYGLEGPKADLYVTSVFAAPRDSALEPHMEEGRRAYQRGNFVQAVQSWQQAAALLQAAGKPYDQSVALTHLAQAYQALGHTRKMLQSLQAALALAQQAGNAAQIAAVFGQLGNAYMITGPAETATQHLTTGLKMARDAGDTTLAATILNNLGNLLTSQSKYDEALNAYQESVSLAQATANHALVVSALTNAAMVSLHQEQYPTAKTQLDQVFASMPRVPPSHDKAYTLITIGLAYNELRQHLPDQQEALLLTASQTYNDATGVAQTIGDGRAVSYARGYLGALYEAEQRYDEALHLTRQALFAAQQVNAPESLYQWQWQTARLLRALGKMDDAIAAYRRAVATLQSIRQEMAFGYGPTPSFRDAVGPVYFELVDLLLQRAATFPERVRYEPYLSEARQTIELFKAAELRDYFQDDCVEAARARATSLDVVSQTAVIVYPIVLSDRLELLVSLPSGLEQFTVPVAADTLTQEVRQFRRNLEKRTTWQFLPHAQQLYDWLIRPLEPALARISLETMVFVPDGPLRTIPMAALHDGQQFLISKYALATTPGLDLTNPQPLRRDKVKMLAVGLTEAVQGFPPLPFVAAELQAIQGLYPSDVMLNESFLVPRVTKEMRQEQFSMVHIASHGQFGSDVERTFLLTFDDKLTMDRLDQLVGLFKYRDDPLELLTLSACQTAAGDDRAALGLAGIAIKAGARSALATLWFVNDQASSDLVTEFYRQLQNPVVSRAVALQRAQLQLIRDPRYEHPGYWSPFLLINNWL